MKRNFRYQLKLFLTAAVTIWAVVLGIAWLQHDSEKDICHQMARNRIRMVGGNLIDAYLRGYDPHNYVDYYTRYFSKSEMNDISMSVYDTQSGRLLYTIGEPANYVAPSEDMMKGAEVHHYSDGSTVRILTDFKMKGADNEIFYYSERTSSDGKLAIRTLLPYSPEINKMLGFSPTRWGLLLLVGLFGTIMAFFITKHQAKNVSLLRDFAYRAATDTDFIPMGDYPPDEIGDISRQIVAIYNARLQSNVRREHEHEIALKAVEEKNTMKRALTNNISHELKTPIGIIRGYVDMLLAEPDMPAEDREHFLHKTQQNVERIVNMLADLSTMIRLEEGASSITVKKINMLEFITSLAEDLGGGAIIGDMKFVYDIPADCDVKANEGLLTSVVTNLARNAKFYSQGTEMGLLLIGKNDSSYTFSFYDNGVGVGEEHLQYLFDRFYRVDVGRSRKSGGTGLGLPIVKSSINSMNGTVIVRNRRGGGLEFIFSLPRYTEDAEPESGTDKDSES